MTRPRKGARRYRLTETSGLTLKAYRPIDYKKEKIRKAKLPPICYVYTPEELSEFARLRGLKISKKS